MARKQTPAKSADSSDFPKKLFYRINEVAVITGVEPYVLRYWENKFPTLAPEKDEHDQRRYRQKDIELIQYIRKLLYEEKYTIAGAQEILKQGKTGKARGPAARPGASSTQPNVVLIVEDEPASAEAAAPPGAQGANKPSSAPDPHLLEGVRKRVGTIREDVHNLVSELKQWRAHPRSGNR